MVAVERGTVSRLALVQRSRAGGPHRGAVLVVDAGTALLLGGGGLLLGLLLGLFLRLLLGLLLGLLG